MIKLWFSLILAFASSTALHADDMRQAMQSFADDNIIPWASDPILIAAIQAQNDETSGYDQSKIDELDKLWRGFLGLNDAEIIANVVSTPAAEFLRDQVARSSGAITEAFIMDARGLNVAASEPTSDYWQGDEEKFTQTYLVGPTAIHFGDVELDDSTQQVQGQVSITMVDQPTGVAIGAITVGINLSALM